MKVYIVTEGDYSDYRICGVFTSRHHAEEYAKANDDDSRVEEWDADDPPSEWYICEVGMLCDGTVVPGWPEETFPVVKSLRRLNAEPHYPDVGFGRRHGNSLEIVMRTSVVTDDEERAIKVANERRTAILLADAWGDQKKARAALGWNEGEPE